LVLVFKNQIYEATLSVTWINPSVFNMANSPLSVWEFVLNKLL